MRLRYSQEKGNNFEGCSRGLFMRLDKLGKPRKTEDGLVCNEV